MIKESWSSTTSFSQMTNHHTFHHILPFEFLSLARVQPDCPECVRSSFQRSLKTLIARIWLHEVVTSILHHLAVIWNEELDSESWRDVRHLEGFKSLMKWQFIHRISYRVPPSFAPQDAAPTGHCLNWKKTRLQCWHWFAGISKWRRDVNGEWMFAHEHFEGRRSGCDSRVEGTSLHYLPFFRQMLLPSAS